MTDPRLLVEALLLVDSLYFIFARLLLPLVPPAAGAMYLLALGTGADPFGVPARARRVGSMLRHHWVFFLVIGVLVGVDTNLGFVAMRYVDPGRRRSSRGRRSCSAWPSGCSGSASA